MSVDKQKGAIIPANPAPEGLRCVTVYVPDDDLYLEAFAGKIHELTTWLSWEKDGTNRAALAAEVWKYAQDYTYQYGWLGTCPAVEMVPPLPPSPMPPYWFILEIERLRRCVEKLENFIMCMLCNCGCGGSGGNQNSEIIDQTIIEQLTELLAPIICDDVGEIDDEKCENVNHFFDLILAFMATIMDFAGSGGLTVSQLVNIIVSAVWSRSVTPVVYALAQAILAWVNTSAIQVAAAWLANNRDVVVAAIYSATSPASAQSAVMNLVSQSGLPAGAKAVLWAIMQTVDWNALFSGEIVAPEGYTPQTACTNQAEVEAPSGYVLEPWTIVNQAGDFNEASGQQSYTDNVAEMRLDQLQSGGYLDATAFVDMDVAEVTAGVTVGFLVVIENYQTNALDDDLIVSENVDTINRDDLPVTGLPATWQLRGHISGAPQAVIDWANDGVQFTEDSYDEADVRFGFRNVIQQVDCIMSCRASFYLLNEIPV